MAIKKAAQTILDKTELDEKIVGAYNKFMGKHAKKNTIILIVASFMLGAIVGNMLS